MWSHEGCADCYRYDLKPKWPHPHIHSQHKNLTICIVTTIVPKTQNCSTHPISSSRHAPSAEAGASFQASCCSRPRCWHPENKSLISKFLIIEAPPWRKCSHVAISASPVASQPPPWSWSSRLVYCSSNLVKYWNKLCWGRRKSNWKFLCSLSVNIRLRP